MRAVTLADTLPAVRWRPGVGSPPSGYPASSPAGADLPGGKALRPARLHRQSGKGMSATAIRGEPSGRPAAGRGRSRSARMRQGNAECRPSKGRTPLHRRRAERWRRAGGFDAEAGASREGLRVESTIEGPRRAGRGAPACRGERSRRGALQGRRRDDGSGAGTRIESKARGNTWESSTG